MILKDFVHAGVVETRLHYSYSDQEVPIDLERMGRQARSEYEAHYTSEHNYAALMDIYQEAITASA